MSDGIEEGQIWKNTNTNTPVYVMANIDDIVKFIDFKKNRIIYNSCRVATFIDVCEFLYEPEQSLEILGKFREILIGK